MARNTLTQSRLKELLSYDPETGLFRHLVNRSVARAGSQAGTCRNDGYVKLSIDGGQYYAHRLAWLYMFGQDESDVDHIDRNPSNNAICNLRRVTKSQNQHNRIEQRNNTSGYKGVTFCKRTGRWRAAIWVNDRPVYLGYFSSPEDASYAYKGAQTLFHSHRPEI